MNSSDIQKDSASSVERPQFGGDTSIFFHDDNNPTILCFNFNDKQVQVCINIGTFILLIHIKVKVTTPLLYGP